MKKIIFIHVFMVMLLLNISLNFCYSSTDVGEAIKILPESTDFVIKFSSTKDFYDYCAVTDKSFLGQPIEDINEIKETLGFNPFDLKELDGNGIDVSRPFGVAISDFKIVEKSASPNMNIIFFIPVKDVEKTVSKIKEIIEDDNPEAKFTKNGELWSWYTIVDSSEPEDLEEDQDAALEEEAVEEDVVEDGAVEDKELNSQNGQEATTEEEISEPQDKSAETEIAEKEAAAETPPIPTYMVNRNGYLFIGANPSEVPMEDTMKFFQNLGKDEKKLFVSPTFTSVTAKTEAGNDIFLYINLGRIFNSNPQIMDYLSPNLDNNDNSNAKNSYFNNFSYIKDYQGLGFNANLKNSDLKANFVVNIVEKSALLNMFKGVTPKREIILGFKEKPLLLMAVVENIQAYWKIIQDSLDKESLDAIKKQFASIKTDYNIDVENDVIQNIGNNLSLGMYDAMSINMANINTLAAIEFKDSGKMKTVIEKLIAKLQPEKQSMVNRMPINGTEVYMIPVGPMQLYAGFIGNDLVITLGKTMFEKAMSAELENGFMKSFKDKPLQTSLKQDSSIFFFDVGEAMNGVKNFAPMIVATNPEAAILMLPAFHNIVKPFDYISAVSRIDGNSMVGEFLFKTHFDKPFFQGFKDVIANIEALSKSMNLNKQNSKSSSEPHAPTVDQSKEDQIQQKAEKYDEVKE